MIGNTRRGSAAGGALLTLAILCSGALTARVDAASIADPAALVTTLDRLRRDADVPVLGVVLIRDGIPVAIETLGGPADTPFRWGSITKSFTGLAALSVAGEGRIDLNRPVREVLGDGYFTNPWSSSAPVRLVHLLTLSSGFADLSRSEWEHNVPLPLWTALARYAPQRVSLWPPGLQHSYSNAAAGLTAAVLERATGMPFEALLAGQVFTPLGMSHARLDPVSDLPGGFRADGKTEIPYWHMTYRAFGALNAPVTDMSHFLTALVNRGRLPAGSDRPPGATGLPPEVVARFLTPDGTLGTAAGLTVGYGAGIYGWVRDGHVFLGHGGDADGYRSRYGVLPDHGRGYAIVINTDNPRLLARLCREVETALVDDLTDHPPLPRAEEPLSPYAGSYYPASSRFASADWAAGRAARAEVSVDGQSLTFRYDGRQTALYPVGGGRFVRPGDPAVTVVFVRDPAGSLYLQGELGNFASLSTPPCPGFLGACD